MSKASGVNLNYHKGQFRLKSKNIYLAKLVGTNRLKNKYKEKERFPDIKFMIRGVDEDGRVEREDFTLLKDILYHSAKNP